MSVAQRRHETPSRDEPLPSLIKCKNSRAWSMRRTVGSNGAWSPDDLPLVGLPDLPILLDLSVVDLVAGGVVPHGFERHQRTAQQVRGDLGGHPLIGDQVVDGVDLRLHGLRVRPAVADPMPGGLLSPPPGTAKAHVAVSEAPESSPQSPLPHSGDTNFAKGLGFSTSTTRQLYVISRS